jgi:hypothetical protein
VSAEPVVLIPQCEECRRVWLAPDADRWRCYLDTDDELVFYSPHCAAREFDNDDIAACGENGDDGRVVSGGG